MELKRKKHLGYYCQDCKVANLCLAKDLNGQELANLEDIIENVAIYEAGQTIFLEEKPIKYLYAMHEGYSKESVINYNGNEHILNFSYPGDILGLGDINENKHSTTATALTQCSICLIPISALKTLTQNEPILLENLLNVLTKKMKNDTVIGLHTNAKLRIAKFLLNAYHRDQERGKNSKEIHFFMSQIDLSYHLGLAFETVSRVLHQFSKQRIIRIKNKNILILNNEALEAYAEGS